MKIWHIHAQQIPIVRSAVSTTDCQAASGKYKMCTDNFIHFADLRSAEQDLKAGEKA